MSEISVGSGSTIDTSYDNVIIIENLENIHGGKSLDVSAHSGDVIPAGTVILVDTDGNYKPNPQTTPGTYDSLPANHSYAGILVASILKTNARASIMVRGTVDETANANAGNAPYLSAQKTALSLIRFV